MRDFLSPSLKGPYLPLTYYGELLEAGVQIYLFNKGMLNTKLMVIDEKVTEIGPQTMIWYEKFRLK